MICKDYVGVVCVNGTCPKALEEVPFTFNCDDCFFNDGCADCALLNTEYCSGQENIEGGSSCEMHI